MVTVIAGSDTYGRVKSVGGTPIVTKFAMLQRVPIYPLESYYYFGTQIVESSGIPFLASSQTTQIDGIQLAKVDRASVVMAYLRGVFGAFVMVGFTGVSVPGIMYLTGEKLDNFARIAFTVAGGLLAVGLVVGSATYLIPCLSRRESSIRNYCGELLSICIDPALVHTDSALAIEETMNELVPSESGDRDAEARAGLLHQLVSLRVQLARRGDNKIDLQTDALLEKLEILDRRDSPG